MVVTNRVLVFRCALLLGAVIWFGVPVAAGSSSTVEPTEHETIRRLASELSFGSEMERSKAAFELRAYGKKSLPILIEQLPLVGPKTTVWILTVLSECESDRARETIRGYLSHPNSDVRCAASVALCRIGDNVGSQAMDVLRRGSDAERRALVGHLSNEEDPQEIVVLVRALRDVDWMVRSRARRALLARLPGIELQGLVQVVARSLLEIHDLSLPGAKTDVIGVLAHFDEPAVHAVLVRDLDDVDVDHRVAAVVALGRMTAVELIDPLIQACRHDESPRVRSESVRSVYSLGGARMAPVLIKGLRDPHRTVRGQAHAALVEIASANPREKVDHKYHYWRWLEWWREARVDLLRGQTDLDSWNTESGLATDSGPAGPGR